VESKEDRISILVIDDDEASRFGLKKALSIQFELHEASNGKEGLSLARKIEPDIVITDMVMPEMDGMELLTSIKKLEFDPIVIFITAYGNERIAVDAMKSGAYDYIAKPFELEELKLIIRNASEKVRLRKENITLRRQLQVLHEGKKLIGESNTFRKVLELTDKASGVDITVLIRGESGTGKELIARAIHENSSRASNNFITFNCATLPLELIESELFGHEKGAFTGASSSRKGKFEAADKGTLFLDEIGDMAAETQAKVLRVLQEGTFERLGSTETKKADVRIVSATNKDLEKGIEDGWFRSDLYYRINVVQIELPPLRERRDDIPLLIEHFINLFNSKHSKKVESLPSDAMSLLINSDWNGNVRELMNVIEKAVALSESSTLTLSDFELTLTNTVKSSISSDQYLSFQDEKKGIIDSFEREYFISALIEHKGNISRTAEQIGIRRQYLQDKLKKLDIEASQYKK